MKLNRLLVILCISVGFQFNSSAQQPIQFQPIDNLEMMIANIFGVQCEGVTVTGVSQFIQSIGRFEHGDVIGLNSGLVMSTGLIMNNNQAYYNQSSYDMGIPGDNDIYQYGIMNGLPAQNYDATYVMFDFVPVITDTVSFEYILASEEYPEYSPSEFTDRFMFLVSENGGNYQNIAFLPGSVSTAVEINTVNPTVNPQYYVNNAVGPASQFFVYDGYTVPFEAKFYAQVGSTYSIKLVIADISDGVYDSALFLNEQESVNEISGTLEVNGSPAIGIVDVFNFVDGNPYLATPVYSETIIDGEYNATNLPTGMYHVRFTPDPLNYPGLAPLYFTDGATWNEAVAIGLPCFLDYADINSETLDVMSGDGSISGNITIDTSYLKSTNAPFPNCAVKLFNVSDEMVAFTSTNTDGNYQFSNVESGNYKVRLDVPYIPQLEDHDIVVDGAQDVLGADFVIELDGIHVEDNLMLSINSPELNQFTVYPNPAKEELTISNSMGTDIDFVFTDLNGKVLFSGKTQNGKYKLDVSNFPSGMYLLNLGNGKIERVSVMK